MRSGLQDHPEQYARGMGLLMQDKWCEKMVVCKCISLRLVVVKFKYEMFIMIVIISYAVCIKRAVQ